ncbi:uncharacterized protein LOC124659077 [Lolium rigidum]|uniref:uncharacterized protein LOC124659077 n=1 Tax=Lolium rigidum TaxID=89674 RepID=UPI001F5C6F0B|nr:uncharacterized protein LOC124659077 [Lolium rigidum]
MHLKLAHTLRSRRVFVANDEKPGPPVYTKRQQITYDTSSKTPACREGTAETALEHYNRLNEEDEHELVKAVESVTFFFSGPWMHVNFLARLKGGTTCVELVPKYFFAELRSNPNKKGFSCVSCVKLDPADSETAPVRGCEICRSRIFHPAAGGHRGALTPRSADGDNKQENPAPKTAKALFDAWICKMQQ